MTVHHPIVAEHGDLTLALYGSFLPVPPATIRRPASPLEERCPERSPARDGEIVLNEGRETLRLTVVNRGDRPIQVGSHYHFVETNRALEFDRGAAYGLPAGYSSGHRRPFRARRDDRRCDAAGDRGGARSQCGAAQPSRGGPVSRDRAGSRTS